MKCPFGLPAKWLKKESCGVRIYEVSILPTGQMAEKKGVAEFGFIMCPFGLPAKWLKKESCGVRIYDVSIWPTGQMAKKKGVVE